MTIAKKKAAFCRRMQTVHRLRGVETGEQNLLQAGQSRTKRPIDTVQGMREPEIQEVPGAKTGQSVECAAVPNRTLP
jgi:ribosomal protein L44E